MGEDFSLKKVSLEEESQTATFAILLCIKNNKITKSSSLMEEKSKFTELEDNPHEKKLQEVANPTSCSKQGELGGHT